MNDRLLAELATVVCTSFLGIAMMIGAIFLARRSTASATWAAIAGFGIVSAQVCRAMMVRPIIASGIPAPLVYIPITVFEVVLSLGGLALAIHVLPRRTA